MQVNVHHIIPIRHTIRHFVPDYTKMDRCVCHFGFRFAGYAPENLTYFFMKTGITTIGIEARIMTDLLVSIDFPEYGDDGILLEEREGGYGITHKMQEIEARLLFAIAAKVRKRLEQLSPAQDVQFTGKPERLTITKDYRIFLPGRGGTELKMGPLPRAVFILFLKHPEGIRFKDIDSFRDELTEIYLRISPRTDIKAVRDSIDRLAAPQTNALSVNCSRLASALAGYFSGDILPSYLITGANGQPRHILLHRSFVTWE